MILYENRSQIALALCAAVFAFAVPLQSGAQAVSDESAVIIEIPADEFNRGTPLRSARGFMNAAELGDYELATEYLDYRNLPDEVVAIDEQELAEQLYVVISRKIQLAFVTLSDEPGGDTADDLPTYRDAVGKIETTQGALTLYLQRVPRDDGVQIWKISNATVARIPELYEDYGYGPIVEAVRQISPKGSILGGELFKWIIAFGSGIAGALIWMLIAWPLGRLVSSTDSAVKDRLRQYLMRPVPAVIFIMTGAYILRDLGLGITGQQVAESYTLVILVIVWLSFATINLLRDIYAAYLRARGRESALMLMRPVTTTLKVLVAALALVIWLDNLGVNVTALVAGLGVGGLAVALVMQKPLEDILGALTLYTQQPVSVGQYCTCGGVTGTVEEISLRTTKIRKPNNTLVVIPNSTFATASIENVSERSRILHRQTVRLAVDTPESKLHTVLEKLRDVLQSHAKVITDASRVRFVELGEFSINVEVFAHIATTDWAEFLAIAEEINLSTVSVLESVGVKLAKRPGTDA